VQSHGSDLHGSGSRHYGQDLSRPSHRLGRRRWTRASSLDAPWTLTCGNGLMSTGRIPGRRLGVKGSRVQIPPSRRRRCRSEATSRDAVRWPQDLLTARFCGIVRHFAFTQMWRTSHIGTAAVNKWGSRAGVWWDVSGRAVVLGAAWACRVNRASRQPGRPEQGWQRSFQRSGIPSTVPGVAAGADIRSLRPP
jgi:hypothetical protein